MAILLRSIAAALALVKADLPAGLEPGAFEVTLSVAGSPDVVKTTNLTTVTFDGLAAGDYTVTACRLAVTGERISPVVSATITVPVPTPDQIDVPGSITLTLA